MQNLLNALSFDVEDYFQVSAFNQAIDRSAWDSHPQRVAQNTRLLLGLLDEHAIRATFYVLGWVADRQPDLVNEIAQAGHEVACHGYSHKLIYTQAPEEFAEETRRARCVLKDLAQQPVVSYRAATYSITQASLWALDTLVEQGFTADSSIFPIRHDRYGLLGGPLEPHYLELRNGGRLLEFPIPTVKFGPLTLPVSGGGYFRLYPYGLSRMPCRKVNSQNRPFVFYLHPWELDPEQPRVDVTGLSRFRHYNNLEKCQARLERLLRDFRFGTLSECVDENYPDTHALTSHTYA
ncbi:MAG: XrtA system polysaccharide deacetylase [Pseudomonadales bacterium]